jgi:hypothetical protein
LTSCRIYSFGTPSKRVSPLNFDEVPLVSDPPSHSLHARLVQDQPIEKGWRWLPGRHTVQFSKSDAFRAKKNAGLRAPASHLTTWSSEGSGAYTQLPVFSSGAPPDTETGGTHANELRPKGQNPIYQTSERRVNQNLPLRPAKTDPRRPLFALSKAPVSPSRSS